MADEDAERRQQELLDATMAEKEEELRVLEEMRREGCIFTPRQSLLRTPPGSLSAAPANLLELSPTCMEQASVVPASLPLAGEKRLLTSPEDVQDAVRRRLAERREVPPVSGILTSGLGREEPGCTPEPAKAQQEDAKNMSATTVEQLAGLATRSTQGIMEAVRSRTSRLNKDEVAAIGAHTERLCSVITHLSIRLAAAEAEVQRLRIVAAPAATPAVAPPASFANALKLGRNLGPVPISRPPGPAVVIYPAEGQREAMKTSDDTREALRGAVNPSTLGIQVAGIRKVGNAGVMVQTTSVAAAEALKKAVPNILRITEPTTRQPLIALTGIDKGATTEKVVSDIIEQNLGTDKWSKEAVAKDLRLLFKKDRRNGRTKWVCQASNELRRSLITLGRLYIGWDVVEVTDHVDVTCCNRCQMYGASREILSGKNHGVRQVR